MAVHLGTHPSADVLKAFGLGKLDESSSGVVMNHLDQCEACRKVVTELSGDDFLARLRQARGPNSTAAPAKTLAEAARNAPPTLGPTTLFNVPPELADHPDYEVLRELGRGGMGVVYQAKHRLSGRVEVLKVMSKALLGQPESKERFIREIQSAARLDHKNVVKMYTALERGELMVLVMEYVPGEDLAQVVKARGPLPVLNACYYVQQAAMGLQHAFEKGMIHRDIKPQNLILAREGKKHIVKVLDFGLAKAMRGEDVDTDLTTRGAMMGTPGYVAPEQSLDAVAADIRADIYSLGCTLYHLLAGTPPFSGRSMFEIVQAHHSMEAKPLNLVRPEVPEALAAVVRKMMAKDEAQRYQTPIEVVRALEPFVKGGLKPLPPQPVPPKGGQRVAAPPPLIRETMIEGDATVARALKPTGPQRSRKWLVVSLAVLLLLAGLAGLCVVLVLRVKTPEGILVIEVNEPNPDVYVDGSRMTVAWEKDGKRAELRVKAGTHRVEIKKDGITVLGEEVELRDGDRRILTARLVAPPEPGTDGREVPAAEAADRRLVARVKEVADLDLMRIPAGEFYMGSVKGDTDAFDNEKPRHKVRISGPFWLGKYKVTVGQFKRFVGATDYETEAEKAKDKWTWRKPGYSDTGFDQTDEHPVVCVSWNDAKAYCAWVAEKTGAKVRLPREAEWEYSCRARPTTKDWVTTKYYFGDNVADLGDYAWYDDNTKPYGTRPCGQKKPNAFGLYDMHGLACEWCDDGKRTYSDDSESDPVGAGASRVFLGGSFFFDSRSCRAAFRLADAPSYRCDALGFRVFVSR